MNLNKKVINQAEIRKGLCLIFSIFLLILGIRVVYVNAAEYKNDKEYEGEAVEAMSWTSRNVHKKNQDKLRIRMANEDGIPLAELVRAEYSLSLQDYQILTRIVEAEATGLDKKSKILVANVILNRLKSDLFPNTIEEVVFQEVNGAVQFSPVSDGRYFTVEITETTIESVNRALAGEDYSKGALYFMERSMSSPSNVRWFDTALTKLFQYRGHEFYK